MALAPLQLGAASVYWLLVVPWLTINSKTPAKAALSLSLTSIIIQKDSHCFCHTWNTTGKYRSAFAIGYSMLVKHVVLCIILCNNIQISGNHQSSLHCGHSNIQVQWLTKFQFYLIWPSLPEKQKLVTVYCYSTWWWNYRSKQPLLSLSITFPDRGCVMQRLHCFWGWTFVNISLLPVKAWKAVNSRSADSEDRSLCTSDTREQEERKPIKKRWWWHYVCMYSRKRGLQTVW